MSFYSELVNSYEMVFPLQIKKANWLREHIMANNISSMLDIGCATGALAYDMVKYLDRMDAFDLDEAMIARANRFYRHDRLEYAVGDMTELKACFPGETYDLITCFGNTLVHLPADKLRPVFTDVADRINEGGWFIGQILNYDYILDEGIQSLPLIDNERVTFKRSYKMDNPDEIRFITELTVKDGEGVYDNDIPLYPLRRNTLEGMLMDNGFYDISFYKDYQGNAAEGDHLPLIFLAKH